MTVNYRVIGSRIKEIRQRNHMTQTDLAEQIDMSVTYISRIETAQKHASLEVLLRISNVLRITVDRLLNGNQAHDRAQYLPELMQLVEDCNSFEKKIIYDVALATKKSLHESKFMQNAISLDRR